MSMTHGRHGITQVGALPGTILHGDGIRIIPTVPDGGVPPTPGAGVRHGPCHGDGVRHGAGVPDGAIPSVAGDRVIPIDPQSVA